MKRGEKVLVPLLGIKDGTHNFEFDINNKFFEYFSHPDLKGGTFRIDLTLKKSSSVSSITYTFKGLAHVPCDICLDEFDLPVEGKETVYIKADDDFSDEISDEVIYLAESDSEVDLSQHIYESICIRLPFRKVHPDQSNGEPGCDKDMLDRLSNSQQSEDSNQETDPRWDNLKKFLEDNN